MKIAFIIDEITFLILYNNAKVKTRGGIIMRTQHTIRRIMLKYCYLFVVAGILSYILSELVVIGSEIISNAINAMFDGDNIDIEYVAGNTLLIIIISMVVTYIKSITNELFSIKVQKDCKNITVESLERVQYRFFEKNEGTIINKLTSDINDMGKLLSEIFPEILQYAVTIITISIALVKMNWLIFAGIVVTFPLVIFTSDMIAKKINDLARKRRGKYDELADIALDNIEGIEVAKAYAIEETLGLRVSSKAKEILKNEYSRNRYQALANGIVLLMKWVPSVGCSLIALFLVLKNTITIGEFMSFLVLFGKISTSLSELPFRIIDAREMLISVKRIEELLCAPKEVSGDYKGSELKNVENIIELKNVSFSYASGNTKCFENRILKDINVSIKQGEKVAIVGASGAGKSTLLKLLCGFEEVDEGDYYLCGQVFSKWDINEARRLISYVPQDSFLFPETILENLAYGAKNIDIEKVENACKKAGIYQKVCELPDGFNTEVGERGANLSGGERQRLSIARAVYKNSPIILLDEPTSALDEQTEKIISKTISENHENTVIIIAHRLSTIKNVDRIYCMDKGEIVEVGNHEELIRKNGIYAALYGKEAHN